MTTVQPAGDVVERLREPENLVRILIWRDYEDARSEGPFDPLKIEAADTIEALRSRLLAAEKANEPFAVLANDYLADTVNFDDDTVMAGRIVSRRNEAGTPPRVTFAHFRAARNALEVKNG